MRTCLIKIPQISSGSPQAFEEVFIQLHEALRGQQSSFEILATAQNIALCFTADEASCDVIAGQIYALAPTAEISIVSDPLSDLSEKSQIISLEIGLARHDLFPLKDFRDFKGDSLSGLLSVLSKCRPGETVFIQLVVRPEPDTSFHHFKLSVRKKLDRLKHIFRIKYWFKRQAGRNLKQKIAEKSSERLFRCNLRVVALTSDRKPDTKLESVFGAMSNFNTLDDNKLIATRLERGIQTLSRFKERSLRSSYWLSCKELATLFHLPNESDIPNLLHVISQRQAPPRELPTNKSDSDISFFGLTNFRDELIPFGIKRGDRRRHVYIVGKSGSGKSKLLELLMRNDIEQGHGVGVLDPHGDLVDNILAIIPKSRIKDVVLLDPSDLAFPPSFNPLEKVPETLKMRVTIGFIEIFKKLFGTNWSPRLEHVLRYTTLALLDTPGTTVLSILQMLTDKRYRQMVVSNIQDNVVKNFWVSEFSAWSEKFDNEAITPLINKVGQFVATNMIRNIVGQPNNKFDFRRFMDEKKILLMKVSKGLLGEENASLLGAIAVTKIYQAAMSRADIPENQRVDFYFYVDEFHNFATDTFGEILSEARKYRLNLTLANQFLGQLPASMRKTVFGNVGSLLSFRVGAEDAQIMADEFKPRFNARDIINLGIRDFCVKISIDGEMREAFSGRTLEAIFPKENFREQCIENSRQNYAKPLIEVEKIFNTSDEKDLPKITTAGAQKTTQPLSEGKFEEPLL